MTIRKVPLFFTNRPGKRKLKGHTHIQVSIPMDLALDGQAVRDILHAVAGRLAEAQDADGRISDAKASPVMDWHV